MVAWPSDIPVSKDNYTEEPPNNVIRSDMGIGPAKVRRRTILNVRNVSFTLTLNASQLTTFDAFYLANDTSAFDFTNPRTNITVRTRFRAAPSYSFDETMWRVGVELEILP